MTNPEDESSNNKISENGLRLLEEIRSKLEAAIQSVRGTVCVPQISDLNTVLFEVACVCGLQHFAVEVLRKELELLEWQDQLKEPVSRPEYYRGVASDHAWSKAKVVATVWLQIAELLLDSRSTADFLAECKAIERAFWRWDMEGRSSRTVQGDVALLKIRNNIDGGFTEQARELSQEIVWMTRPYEKVNAGTLTAHLLMYQLETAAGNDDRALTHASSLIEITRRHLIVFTLPLSLWRQIFLTLLQVRCCDEGKESQYVSKILESWRLMLDTFGDALREASTGKKEAFFAREESHYARAKGDSLLDEACQMQARGSYRKALRLATRAHYRDPRFLAQCHGGIAKTLHSDGFFSAAELRLRKSIEFMTNCNSDEDEEFRAGILRSLSITLESMHRFVEAMAVADEADTPSARVSLAASLNEPIWLHATE